MRYRKAKYRYMISLLNKVIFSHSMFPNGYVCLEFNYNIYIIYI